MKAKPLAKWSGQTTQSNHLGQTCKHMKTNLWQIIRPRHPAQPSGRKNPLTGEPFGGKETKEKLWQNDLAKPSSKAFIWDTHETDSKHVAKQSNQADHESKPLAS